MEQLFVNLEKNRYENKRAVRSVLASKHPDMSVQAILDSGDTWFARLVPKLGAPSKLEESLDDSDLPPLPGEDGPPKDDAEDGPPKDDEEAPDEDAEPKDEADKDPDEDKEDKGEKKDKKPKKNEDLAGEVQGIIDQLTTLLGDLGGKAGELQGKHDEKADKLKDIADISADGEGPKGPGDLEDTPEEIGPTPGGPDLGGPGGPGGPMDGPLPVPKGPSPAKGFDARKKPQVGVPAFTNSKMVSTPLFKDNGQRVTVATTINRIYSMDKYAAYEVSGIQPDEEENRYVVHLILKEQ